MKLTTRALVALTVIVVVAKPAVAQSARQIVRFRVLPQQAAVVQPMTAAMTVRDRASAVATGSYAFSANESNRKITASLDEPMPEGSSLAVSMTAPDGARSTGETILGMDAADVVTAIPASQSNGLPVRYVVRAPQGLGSAGQRLVTYTVTGAP